MTVESAFRGVARRSVSTFAAGVIILGAVIGSVALTSAQETSYSWSSAGHSLVIWLSLALISANVGTFRQALLLTPATLTVCVAMYYVILAHFGRTVDAAFVFLLVFWLVAGGVGGIFLAWLSEVALRNNRQASSWLARGAVIGTIVGATLNSALAETLPVTASAWQLLFSQLGQFEIPTIAGIIGAAGYGAYVVVRCRPPLTWLAAVLPIGVLAGWAIVTFPGLLLEVAR